MFNKISTKIKLSVVVFVLTVMTGSILTTAIFFFMQSSLSNVIDISQEMEYIHRLQLAIQLQVMPPNDFLISGDKKLISTYEEEFNNAKKRIKILGNFKLLTKQERSLLNQAANILFSNDKIAKQVFSLKNPIGNPAGNKLMIKMDDDARNAIAVLDKFHEIDHEEIEKAEKSVIDVRNYSLFFLISAIFASSVAVFVGWYFSRSIVVPISQLTVASKSVAEGKYEKIEIKRKDEIGTLANSFNVMVNKIKESFSTIQEYTKKLLEEEKRRQEQELSLAQNIQKRLLPRSAPRIKNLEIGFVFKPAKAIGGDFYDFIPVDENTIMFSIGDVVGKSISAAMLTSMNKYVLKSTALQTGNIEDPVRTLNKVLIGETAPDVFATIIFGQFSSSKKELSYINAGHTPFIHFKQSNKKAYLVENSPQVAVGIRKDVGYKKSSINYENGDIFIFVTDGVTESRNKERDLFGFDEIFEILKTERTPQKMADKILSSALIFCDNIQADDITVLVFKAA